jgi:hypothetical protein
MCLPLPLQLAVPTPPEKFALSAGPLRPRMVRAATGRALSPVENCLLKYKMRKSSLLPGKPLSLNQSRCLLLSRKL